MVRRARNVKVSPARRAEQSAYRRSTAFEALIGYLYLTDLERLRAVLAMTMSAPAPVEADSEESEQNNP